jgi:transcriptional regulator with XRE-family HTH domain
MFRMNASPTYDILDAAMYPRWMSEFGQRFKTARKQRGLSQEQIAAVMGVSRVSVSHYENGKNFPQIAELVRFCDEYKVSMDWLVLGRQPTGAYEARIHELPEGLKLYVLEALLLAERVAQSLPAKFLAPPTTANYVAFSEYLTKLSEEGAHK